jgi:hypothetical protein
MEIIAGVASVLGNCLGDRIDPVHEATSSCDLDDRDTRGWWLGRK